MSQQTAQPTLTPDGLLAEYTRQTKLLVDALGERCPWPASLLTDPTKAPTVIGSAEAMKNEIRRGCHLNKIMILPNGADNFGQKLPCEIQKAVEAANTTTEFLDTLAQSSQLADFKGKVFVQEREEGSEGCIDTMASGVTLEDVRKSLKDDYSAELRDTAYLAELRSLTSSRRGPSGRWRKCLLESTMRERIGMEQMMYWDDYSGGIFVGRHATAYSLHVDQMQTSNVGTQFNGHKLLAIWEYPKATKHVMKTIPRSVFAPPLSCDQLHALEDAVSVALVPPGAVWIFSGANAHATCNVGFGKLTSPGNLAPSLCANSYEAFSGIHPTHVKALVGTNTDVHSEDYWMEPEDCADFKEDIRRHLDDLDGELDDELNSGSANHDSITMLRNAIMVGRVFVAAEHSHDSSARCRSDEDETTIHSSTRVDDETTYNPKRVDDEITYSSKRVDDKTARHSSKRADDGATHSSKRSKLDLQNGEASPERRSFACTSHSPPRDGARLAGSTWHHSAGTKSHQLLLSDHHS